MEAIANSWIFILVGAGENFVWHAVPVLPDKASVQTWDVFRAS